MEILSRRIKELREENYLTQKALAQKIGVTQKAVDFWKKGHNEPKATYIRNLAITFNVKAGYLLGLENRDD